MIFSHQQTKCKTDGTPQHEATCPRCKLEIETRDHILRCEKSSDWRIQFHHTLRHTCDRLNTHPGLKDLLQRGLLEWFRGNDVMPAVNGYPDEFVARTNIFTECHRLAGGDYSMESGVSSGPEFKEHMLVNLKIMRHLFLATNGTWPLFKQ